MDRKNIEIENRNRMKEELGMKQRKKGEITLMNKYKSLKNSFQTNIDWLDWTTKQTIR